MSQKVKKSIVLCVVLLISVIFSRCQNDENLSNPAVANVAHAKKWFKEYEANGDNIDLFQNLNYEWSEADVKQNKDGLEFIVVPIAEVKKDQNENWEQKLYIYKLGTDDYKALLYEFYPENQIAANIGNFNGYIGVWDLKKGFVRSAKFVNNSIVENGVVAVLTNEQLKLKSLISKQDKKHLDDEDSIGDGSGSQSLPSPPTPLKEVVVDNLYKDPYVYVYFPGGADTSGYNSVDYTSNYTGGGGGGGSASGSGSASGNPIMPPPPKLPISDIKKFLSCLNTAASANLTVYAEKTDLSNLNVGHAFISISQGNNVMVYGFYPENGYDKSFSGPGIMGENGGHIYNVSGNIGQITLEQLQKIISLSEKYQSSWYELDTNNCSDFATDVLNIVGVKSNNQIDTPDTVASILEKLPNHTSKTNYAPKTKRTCP